jgi:aspartyl-tRNA(Asn)/glutamyl-tRNA(Gln) amidotransferase subunit B
VLLYLGVSDGRMEQGSLRAEPNPSVRPVGSDTFGVKTELKNLNSFRAVQRGVEYEAKRQVAIIESGGKIVQGTYGWNEEKEETFLQRPKEFEQEYRYFPEPDLIPIAFESDYIGAMRATLPELPIPKKRRLMEQYCLPAADAALLVADRETADYFEATAEGAKDAKAVANWMLGDLSRLANAAGKPVYATPVTAANLAEMIRLIESGTITGKIAKQLIEEMSATGKGPGQLVEEKGLKVTSADEVAGIVTRVVAANPDVVAKVKAGNDKSIGFLVGQVMKEAKGSARPDDVNRLLKEAIDKA